MRPNHLVKKDEESLCIQFLSHLTRIMSTFEPTWKSLPEPSISGLISSISKLNSTHFIIANSSSLCSYDIESNKWNRINTPPFQWSRMASNPQTQEIFTIGLHDTMMIFNMKENTHNIYESNIKSAGRIPSMICIDSELHIISSSISNTMHYVWDPIMKKLQCVHQFNEYPQGMYGCSLVYNARKRELLLFGGVIRRGHGYVIRPGYATSDDIHKYSLQTRKWQKLQLKLPHRITPFGCIITKDQRYIILLGGKRSSDIFVLDLNEMKVTQAMMKLPFKGRCAAVIMENKQKNELLVDGFVKNEMKMIQLNVPFAIIKLIGIWHSTEYVHVFNDRSSHWVTNVDKILNLPDL